MQAKAPWEALDLAAFSKQTPAYDALVGRTPGIDRFCSTSTWVLPAFEAFPIGTDLFIRKSKSGYLVFQNYHSPQWGRTLLPLEASWCLASPLIGEDPQALTAETAAGLLMEGDRWDTLFLCGITEGSFLWRGVAQQFYRRGRLFMGPSSARCQASLEGGISGYLSRRSRKFRKNLRSDLRRAEGAGLRFEHLHGSSFDANSCLSLMNRIEARSWKGLSSQGVNQGSMQVFYRAMLRMPSLDVRFHLGVARLGEEAIGFLFGADFAGIFRGFQFSFLADHTPLTPGNFMQYSMLENICNNKNIHTYDFGMEMDYKKRWAEQLSQTDCLIFQKT